MPNLYIIGGPNGAGKTTAAYTFLPDVLDVRQFVNADEIARGISPFEPESVAIQAGKVMLQRINQLLDARESFAIETTLTTISYLKTIAYAKSLGYQVSLLFVWLNNEEIAKERVNRRVKKGGHGIDEKVISRRYVKGLINLPVFMRAVNDWYLYDNSGSYYELVAKKVDDREIIINFDTYQQIVSYGK
jgi:predicted ABC-type ATPase